MVRVAIRCPVLSHESGGSLLGSHGRQAEAYGLHERCFLPFGHQAVGLETDTCRRFGYNISGKFPPCRCTLLQVLIVVHFQCGCTAGDLERMAGVIANKLGVQMGHAPITSVSYLRIYYALFRNLAKEIGGDFFKFYQQLIKLEELENRLEILLCDVKTTVITPATLALVLICLHLDFHIKESYTRGSPELKHVFEYILFLQQYMRVSYTHR